MGIMRCARVACDEIMCASYVTGIGYICSECKNEFKNYISNKGVKLTSEQQLRGELNTFMDTYKHVYNNDMYEIDIDAFFDEYST